MSNDVSGTASRLMQLRRFLCFGVETGTYVAVEGEDFGLENAQSIIGLIESNHGKDAVAEILKFSKDKGNTSRKFAPVFALAACARRSKDVMIRQEAYKVFEEVCSTSVELFQFIDYAEKLEKSSGWGRGQRRAISLWYNNMDPVKLAEEVTRYRTRRGWSHQDVVRLAHVKPKDPAHNAILMYLWKGLRSAMDFKERGDDRCVLALNYLEVVEKVKHSKDEQEVARLVEQHQLYPDQIPTWMNKSKEVWRALVCHMRLADILENIERLAMLGLLDALVPDSVAALIIERLKDTKLIHESKIQPLSVLLSMRNYEKSKPVKGKKPEWTANGAVVDAMKQAFYASIKNVERTGKRYLLAVDVSASMQYGEVNGAEQITPSIAMSAMALLTIRTENICDVVGFSNEITRVSVNNTMNLEEVQHAISEVKMGGTDCAKPIEWAAAQKKEVDAFIVYTDCETWTASSENPARALAAYRQKMNLPNAKLIVCALTSNGFTVADPSDPGMLDVAGFDAAAPGAMRRFIMEEL